MIVPVLSTQFLERALKLYPHKLAVVCEEKRFSYQEYGKRVNQLSNVLLDMGVRGKIIDAESGRQTGRTDGQAGHWHDELERPREDERNVIPKELREIIRRW